MFFNFNNFLLFLKKKINITEEKLEKIKYTPKIKNIIGNNFSLLAKIYFKNLNLKLNIIKQNKFNIYISHKDLISEYNEIIKYYNKYIYNYKYKSVTLENLIQNNNVILYQTEIYPYTIIDYFYNFEKSQKKKYLENTGTINYKIKGLICFLNFKETKIKRELKLYVISDEVHKQDLYVIDLMEVIKKKNINLYSDIENLLKIYLVDQWKNYKKFCEENYKKKNEENFLTNINVGFLCCLSISKENISKKKILEYLYCEQNIETNLHLHLYFVLYQYSKQSNKFNVCKLQKSFNSELLQNNILNISYEPEKLKSDFTFSIGYLKLNEIENICFLNYNKKNIKIIELKKQSMTLDQYYNFLISNEYIKIDEKNKIVLTFENKCIKTDLSDILYSNFLNNNKKINYNKLLLDKNDIYIPDILIRYKQDIRKNIIYKNINEIYFIKKNNIIIKKNINLILEKLFNIDNNEIDWISFLESSIKENLKDITINNLFIWFQETYEKHKKKNEKKAYYIKNLFISANLDFIYNKTLFKDINSKDLVKNTEDYTYLKNFFKFFEKYYIVTNNIIKKKKDFENSNFENSNFDYIFFVEILKIIFFLNEI